MTASELQYREMSSSVLREFYISNCHSPITLKGKRNTLTGEVGELLVPCGKCKHCVETYQNEWVSRCLLETDSHKYCYFITLTYRPFDRDSLLRNSHRCPIDLEEYALSQIHKNTLTLADDYNWNHEFCKRPCVLDKSHLQNYWKRLRQLTYKDGEPVKLRYFECGEYGHTFCAPHYHAIVWSDRPISNSMFCSAWRYVWTIDKKGYFVPYRGHRTPKYNISLGNVQVQNLLESITKGTSKRAFRYVAKYVTKAEYNSSRVERAWDSIEDSVEFVYNSQNQLKYEDYSINPNSEFSRPDAEEGDRSIFAKYYKGFYYTKEQFVKFVRPFHLCSKCPTIGGLYLLQNISRFAAGNLTIGETLGEKRLIFPSYFRRKVKEKLFPLRLASDSVLDPRHIVVTLSEFILFWSSLYHLKCLGILPPNPSSFQLQTILVRAYSSDFASLLFRHSRYFDLSLRCTLEFVSERMAFACYVKERGKPRPQFLMWMELDDFMDLYLGEDADRYYDLLFQFDEQRKRNQEYMQTYISKNPDLFPDFREQAISDLNCAHDNRQTMYHLTHDTAIDYVI